MAKPTVVRWTKLSIWPGDGASPETFTSRVCGLTAKSFALAGSASDTVVPDCDDPDAPAWIDRIIRSLSSTVTGSGIMAQETWTFWRDWMLSALAKNVRIVVTTPASPGYFAGNYVLTGFELTGNEGNGFVNVSITMQSNGPVAWTNDASPAT